MSPSVLQIQTASVDRTSTFRPLFSLKEVTFFCWAIFLVMFAVPVTTALKSTIQSGRLQQEERDFIFFYGMGRMLNEYPPSQLYDFEAQKKVDSEVLALKNGRQYTPNPYPPFVALLFRPFALLPYSEAYPLWLAVSFALYIVGLALAAGTFFPTDLLRRSLVFCFALSFSPFLWILLGGQIPTIGFIGLALAFCEEDKGHPFLSGLGLSLCLYKPTLLVLILPMLLVTRRYKTLAGFAGGGALLAGLVTAVEGLGVWSGYFRILLSFGKAAANAHGYRVLPIYMDLSAFSSLLPGGRSWLGGTVILGCACWAAFSLFNAWRKHRGAGRQAGILVWAATLTWTLVLNLYVPIYDSILGVIGVIATAAVLRGFADARLRRQFTIVWILILAASWVTLQLAEKGFQIFTVLFALLGTVQLVALGRIEASTSVAESGG